MSDSSYTYQRIDNIYDAIDALLNSKCWSFIDDILFELIPKVWRMDVDSLLAYLISTHPAKSKLVSRQRLLDKCKEIHPDPDLWKGLE